MVVDETRPNHALVTARLEKWCQTVAGGDCARFERRLAGDGLNLDTVQRVLGPVRLADGQPLPSWVHTLEVALAAAREEARFFGDGGFRAHEACSLDPEAPIPFEDVLWPFVLVARRRLADAAGTG